MENKKAVAIFGGSFNPPLCSHFSLAQQVINEFNNINKIIFVPVNSKYQKAGLIENEHRYNMLKLVCDKNEQFEVSDIELKQDRQLYTIETLELLQKQYPNEKIYFIIGTDNLKELITWNSPEKLINQFNPIVLERGNDKMEEIINQDLFLLQNKESFMKLKQSIRTNCSSTFARESIKNGKSIRYLTPDEIYYYIKQNQLYNA